MRCTKKTHSLMRTHTPIFWQSLFVMNLYCTSTQAKVSPHFKSSYSETLAKLEHQYCKLLVSFLCVFAATHSLRTISQLILLDHGNTLTLKGLYYYAATPFPDTPTPCLFFGLCLVLHIFVLYMFCFFVVKTAFFSFFNDKMKRYLPQMKTFKYPPS